MTLALYTHSKCALMTHPKELVWLRGPTQVRRGMFLLTIPSSEFGRGLQLEAWCDHCQRKPKRGGVEHVGWVGMCVPYTICSVHWPWAVGVAIDLDHPPPTCLAGSSYCTTCLRLLLLLSWAAWWPSCEHCCGAVWTSRRTFAPPGQVKSSSSLAISV